MKSERGFEGRGPGVLGRAIRELSTPPSSSSASPFVTVSRLLRRTDAYLITGVKLSTWSSPGNGGGGHLPKLSALLALGVFAF